MPVEVTIKGKSARFPTPMAAITRMIPELNNPEGGIDPLALAHATCVATALATAANTGEGRRAMETLSKMVEAFEAGNTDKGIRYAVALGMDSLLRNSRQVGANSPKTCEAFQAAYDGKSEVAAPTLEAPDDSSSTLDDDEEDDDDDWADPVVEPKE